MNLNLHPQFNIFWGSNGAGKTSLLEAIHVLTTGRSFRAHPPRQIISFEEKSCTISGVVSSKQANIGSTRLGVERFQTGGIKIRLAEQNCQSIAELARILPLQLINSDSYDILEANPQYRRQFLDWAMFHVEQTFYPVWQRFKRALQQRNAALKEAKFTPASNIRVWDKELAETGAMIDSQRRALLDELMPIFKAELKSLLDLKGEVVIQYQAGWEGGKSLEEALEASWDRDKAWGYTTVGPQRADLEFLVGDVPAKSLLSRGQLKLFICALLMARALLLYRRKGYRCVFLIDDLSAELDREASKLLLQGLSRFGGQVLMTSVEGESLVRLLEDQGYAIFEVKEGQIIPESVDYSLKEENYIEEGV